jgi:hypothetical protein
MSSTVSCGHPTGLVTTASEAKLKVLGAPVLLESSVAGKPVAGCLTPVSQGNKPCTTAKSVLNTPPAKLRVAGAPVLTEAVTGETDGQVGGVAPQPLLSATANQTKLLTT